MNRTNPAFLISGTLLLSLAATEAAAGEIQAYIGDPLAGGRIEHFQAGTGQALPIQDDLRGLRLVSLDFNGRLAIDELDPSLPRWQGDVPGAGRIQLAGEQGVLYRFERVLSGLPKRFGYLLVESSGAFRILAEVWGTGPGGEGDPYGDRIALAPDAARFLVATSLEAGGNLMEVDLASGQVDDRSAGLPPLELRRQSLRYLDGWLVAVGSRSVLRASTIPGSQLEPVTLGPGTSYFSGELVTSPDGSHAMTTAGSGPQSLHAWTIASSGPAQRATDEPWPISGAGFLPEAPHGPFLAVADDGVLCAWRIEGVDSRELFARRATAPAGQAATHVTADGVYADTLDEAGLLGMYGPDAVVFAVGERTDDPGVGIEKVDFFELRLDAGGSPQLQNLSLSSGQAGPPFDSIPELGPSSLRWLPAAQATVFYDEQSGGTGRLASFDPATSGVQTLVSEVKEVFFIELVGSSLLVSLRMDSQGQPHRLLRFSADLTGGSEVVQDAGDAELLRPVVDASGWIAYVEVPEVGQQRLHRYDANSASRTTFPVGAQAFGPVLAWTEDGDLALSLDRAGLRYFAGWPRPGGAPYRLQVISSTGGALLPGR